jgi:hypothetical protein
VVDDVLSLLFSLRGIKILSEVFLETARNMSPSRLNTTAVRHFDHILLLLIGQCIVSMV